MSGELDGEDRTWDVMRALAVVYDNGGDFKIRPLVTFALETGSPLLSGNRRARSWGRCSARSTWLDRRPLFGSRDPRLSSPRVDATPGGRSGR